MAVACDIEVMVEPDDEVVKEDTVAEVPLVLSDNPARREMGICGFVGRRP